MARRLSYNHWPIVQGHQNNKTQDTHYKRHNIYNFEQHLKLKFCPTLGQTGTGVLSCPWALCLSHHFFCNTVYNLSNFFFFFYTELNVV
jgi:hypothetical protein